MAEVVVTDGRRARRERGRLAVVDAMVDLVQEGRTELPSAQEIAQRAGVSQSSLFRYFDSLDELRHESVSRFFVRNAALFEIPDLGAGSFAARVDRLVAARLRLYETVAPTSRFARSRAYDNPVLSESLLRVRTDQAAQIRAQFAEELAPLAPSTADDLVVSIAGLTSFESWDLARETLGRTERQVARAWTDALTTLLTRT